MAQVIWVEILSRHREVVARHRFAGAELRIGRGYDNDLVLDDPHVAVSHLRIFRTDAGGLVAEDIGSANGLFLDRDPRRQERVALHGDAILRIGTLLLRVREAGYVVARERPLTPPRRRWPLAAALAAAIFGLEALTLWLAETGEPKASHYVMPLLGLGAFTLAWTAVWAMLSRVFAGEARFGRTLVVALAGLLGYTLYVILAETAAYSLAWRWPEAYAYAVSWVVLGLVAFVYLRAIVPRHRLAAAGAVTGFAVLAIATQTLSQSEAHADFGQQSYLHRLLPPAMRLAPLKNEAAFFGDVAALQAQIDRDRETGPGDER